MIRLLVAEDQAMLLSALASLLDLEDDMQVVHRAGVARTRWIFCLKKTSRRLILW